MFHKNIIQAGKNFRRYEMKRLKTYYFFEHSANILSEMYFTFSSPKTPLHNCALARTFHNV